MKSEKQRKRRFIIIFAIQILLIIIFIIGIQIKSKLNRFNMMIVKTKRSQNEEVEEIEGFRNVVIFGIQRECLRKAPIAIPLLSLALIIKQGY